jgi:oligopeptide transport system substrate-binding protein
MLRLKQFVWLCLILLTLPVGLAHAADPVTAHVVMLPVANLDPVSLPRDDFNARDLVENLFLGLTRYDAASRRIVPALARDWTVSDDGLTWTVNVRDDVKWVRFNAATGQVEALRSVVADDFVYALRRACDPQPPNPATHSVYIVAGCLRVATANPSLVTDLFIARELWVRAVNDFKLEIRITFPAPYFVSLLALPEFRPVPREAITAAPDWTKFGTILTNGPWVISAWTPGQQMTLIRNLLWPDPMPGNVEQVVVSFVQTPEALAQQFSSGSADFARLDSASALAAKQVNPDGVLMSPEQAVAVLGFSGERKVTSSGAFRRALAQSINREALVSQVLPGAAVPTSRFTPPGAIGSPTDPPDNSGYQPEGARAALSAAGFAKCKLPEKLTLVVEDRPAMVALAKALIEQWETVLGCRADSFAIRAAPLNYVEAVAHAAISASEKTDPPRAQLWLVTWRPDYADANAWLGDGLHCQFGFLRPGLPCGEADKRVDAAALEADPVKRAALYQEAESLWFGSEGSFPVAPLFLSYEVVGQQARLKGATTSGSQWFAGWILTN